MVDGIVEVTSKPGFLEVSHTDFCSHISLINNIVIEDQLQTLAEFDSSSSTKASEIQRFIDETFGKIITANTEEKITSLSRHLTKCTLKLYTKEKYERGNYIFKGVNKRKEFYY